MYKWCVDAMTIYPASSSLIQNWISLEKVVTQPEKNYGFDKEITWGWLTSTLLARLGDQNGPI